MVNGHLVFLICRSISVPFAAVLHRGYRLNHRLVPSVETQLPEDFGRTLANSLIGKASRRGTNLKLHPRQYFVNLPRLLRNKAALTFHHNTFEVMCAQKPVASRRSLGLLHGEKVEHLAFNATCLVPCWRQWDSVSMLMVVKTSGEHYHHQSISNPQIIQIAICIDN